MSGKAGKQVKAFIFFCLLCDTQVVKYSMNNIPPTAAEAAEWVREEGWSKKKNGCWYCPQCKLSRPTPKLPESTCSAVEGEEDPNMDYRVRPPVRAYPPVEVPWTERMSWGL